MPTRIGRRALATGAASRDTTAAVSSRARRGRRRGTVITTALLPTSRGDLSARQRALLAPIADRRRRRGPRAAHCCAMTTISFPQATDDSFAADVLESNVPVLVDFWA